MAQRYLSRQEVRRVDQRAVDEYGMHSLVLMENAGRGCVDALVRRGLTGPVNIHCGKGNNGGDGLVIARHLDLRGYPVRVFLWADAKALRGDAWSNYQIALAARLPLWRADALSPDEVEALCTPSQWEVDALLGTGAKGAPRDPADRAIALINRRRSSGDDLRVCAIDLPSGLDCDSGQAAGETVRADLTLTFVAPKLGFQTPSATGFVGELEVLSIGAPRLLIEQTLAAAGSDVS